MSTTHTTTAAPPARGAWLGATRVAPLMLGIGPFGFALGATGSASDLPPLAAWASAVLVYGGSIQLVVLRSIEDGSAPAIVAATALVAILPRCCFAVALAPQWSGTSLGWRALASYWLVEGPVAVVTGPDAQSRDRAERQHMYLGAAAFVFVTWLLATGSGALIGGQLPSGLGAEIITPVMMLAIAVSSAPTRAGWAGAATAGLVSLVGAGLPHGSSVLIAALCGLGVATIVERHR